MRSPRRPRIDPSSPRRPAAWALGGSALVALAFVALPHPAAPAVATAQDGARATGAPARVRGVVRIVVLGALDRSWIPPIRRELEQHLEVAVEVEPRPVPLPRAAYYPPRRRYRSERLTDFLIARYRDEPATTRLLGLTNRDISTEAHGFRDYGILGQSNDVPGRAAVVSSFRMRRRASAEHALWRMTTTAVHEMGHILGLPHCTEARCLMRDAEGTMDTVDEGDGELGPECRALLDHTAPRDLVR